jgi:hypothetical protein
MRSKVKILIIEGRMDEEKRICRVLAGMMPDGVTHNTEWKRTLEHGLSYLLVHNSDVDVIICQDVQPERVPTRKERERLIVVECRPERRGEVHRLMQCMNMLNMNRPFLIGLREDTKDDWDLRKPQDYHGPDGLTVGRHFQGASGTIIGAIHRLMNPAAA